MTTFLERYRHGERERVWADLLACGEQVRREPLFSDAYSVARETMIRAKHNTAVPAQPGHGRSRPAGWVHLSTVTATRSPP